MDLHRVGKSEKKCKANSVQERRKNWKPAKKDTVAE